MKNEKVFRQTEFEFAKFIDGNKNHILFSRCDILACPQHIEAKILANKYWNSMANVSYRIDKALWDDSDGLPRILNGLLIKYEKTEKEFEGIIRGLNKCCYKR